MIIDSHIHLGSSIPWIPNWQKYNTNFKQLQNIMNENKITKIIAVANPQIGNYRKANNYILNASNKDKRIYGFIRVDPRNPKLALKEIDYFYSKGFLGIKINNEIEYSIPFTPEHYLIYDLAKKLKLPILFHQDMPKHPASPYFLEKIFKERNKQKFILAHMYNTEGIDIVSKYNNVLQETSFGTQDLLKYALDKIGSKRIIFSSDWPYNNQKDELNKIYNLKLSINETNNLLYKNITKFLK